MQAVWDDILQELQRTHTSSDDLQNFCPIADDLEPRDVPVAGHGCTDRFLNTDFGLTPHTDFVDAIKAATDLAHWRQTYAGTDIGDDFLNRFGCYCLIGTNAPWTSKKMSAFFVYMPADFWYTWHSHPAEEMYFVIAGSARFYVDGEPSVVLTPGQAMFHPSGKPHALHTEADPILALVMWRNHLSILPTLMPDDWRPT